MSVTGIGWGLLEAFRGATVEGQFVERAAQGAVVPVVSSIYVEWVFEREGVNASPQERDALIDAFQRGERLIQLGTLRLVREDLRELISAEAVGFTNSIVRPGNDDLVAALTAFIQREIWRWLINRQLDRELAQFDGIIARFEAMDDGSGTITAPRLADAVTSVYVTPAIAAQFASWQNWVILGGLGQLLSFAGVPALVLSLIGVLGGKPTPPRPYQQPPPGTTPTPTIPPATPAHPAASAPAPPPDAPTAPPPLPPSPSAASREDSPDGIF